MHTGGLVEYRGLSVLRVSAADFLGLVSRFLHRAALHFAAFGLDCRHRRAEITHVTASCRASPYSFNSFRKIDV